MFADRAKICVDFVVGISKDFQPVLIEYCRTFCIIRPSRRLIMVRTIDLNHQLCRMTVKIGNKGINCFLPLETNRVCTKKVIPKVSFLRCGILAQLFCAWDHI